MLRSLISIKGAFVPNDAGPPRFQLGKGPLHSRANFDEIGGGADPEYRDTAGRLIYAIAEDEVADIRDAARFICHGPTNALEWHFALRVDLEMGVAAATLGTACGLPYLHREASAGVPRTTFVAECGPLIPLDAGAVPKGSNHLDVCAAGRQSRRDNRGGRTRSSTPP